MRVTVQHDFVSAVAELLNARARAEDAIRRTLTDVGARGIAHLTRTYRQASSTTPTATAVRSARLWRAYSYLVVPASVGTDLIIGIVAPTYAGVLEYAAIHEYGGIIRPRNATYLAIPLPGALTAAGVARGGPRDYQDTFVAPGRSGNLIIFQRGDPPVPLFLLTRGPITIPARPALEPTVREFVLPELEAVLTRDVATAIWGWGR